MAVGALTAALAIGTAACSNPSDATASAPVEITAQAGGCAVKAPETPVRRLREGVSVRFQNERGSPVTVTIYRTGDGGQKGDKVVHTQTLSADVGAAVNLMIQPGDAGQYRVECQPTAGVTATSLTPGNSFTVAD